MKKTTCLLLFLLSMLLTVDVYAAAGCSNADYKDLGQIASYVKADYEVIDNSEIKTLTVGEETTTYKVPNYTFAFTIYNVNEDIYVDIENEKTKDKKTIYYDDTEDGTYTFDDYNFGDVYNYKIVVYANRTSCSKKKLKTLRVSKPKYNAYSEFTYCGNSSSYYCQKFITGDLGIDSTSEFLKKIEVNNQKNDPKKDEKDIKKQITDILKNNWKIYLAIFVVVSGTFTGLIIYKKRANKKKGWNL